MSKNKKNKEQIIKEQIEKIIKNNQLQIKDIINILDSLEKKIPNEAKDQIKKLVGNDIFTNFIEKLHELTEKELDLSIKEKLLNYSKYFNKSNISIESSEKKNRATNPHRVPTIPLKQEKSTEIIKETDNLIIQKIEKSTNEILMKLKSTDSISTTLEEINENNSKIVPKIEQEIKAIKDDFSFILEQEFESNKEILKGVAESVEVLPKKVDKISKKLDELDKKIERIDCGSSQKTPSDISTDERSIVELSTFMSDGLKEFEKIARYYVNKTTEFEKLENDKKQQEKLLEDAKNEAINQTKKNTKVELAKEIFERFPSEFEKIQSIFDDIISNRYRKGEEIEVTRENEMELARYIENIKIGKIKIDTPDISIDDDIIKRATIKTGFFK